jgi:predicted nucleic acid-binding protein
MTVVLDTSAAVEAAIGGPSAVQIRTLLETADVVIAPDIFISEVTNVLWKYRKFSSFTEEKCLGAIEFCVSLVDVTLSCRDLWREAFFEGAKNSHTTYDMFYLVAARRNMATLVTRDKRLKEIAESEGIVVLS